MHQNLKKKYKQNKKNIHVDSYEYRYNPFCPLFLSVPSQAFNSSRRVDGLHLLASYIHNDGT